MSTPLFDCHVIVDWSARSAPSPAHPARDAIWFAVARGGELAGVEYVRTRDEAVARLTDLFAAEVAAGRRVLAGFDFPFGYPQGVAAHLTGEPSARALWRWLAERIEDAPDNRNNRYAVAEIINRQYDGIGPCWGRPESWRHPDLPVTMKERRGQGHPPERRLADQRAKGAKTVWQTAYSGSVGSQVLLGLPALERILSDPRLAGRSAVWPLDTGLAAPGAPVVLAEIYPSLLTGLIREEQGPEEILDRAQVRVNALAFARLDADGGLEGLFRGPTDLDDAGRHIVEREEAWILGLGAETALASAYRRGDAPASAPSPGPSNGAGRPALAYERDPHEIYRQSWATVRAEARLDHLPGDLHDVAVRMVHACGMTDLPNRLAWSDDLGPAARRALRAGAPILCDAEMVASGIVRARLPAGNPVVCTLNDPATPDLAQAIGNTRSAAAVELWRERLEGALAVIGNAPTALFPPARTSRSGLAPARRDPRPAGRLRRRGGVQGRTGSEPARRALPDPARTARRIGHRLGGSERACGRAGGTAMTGRDRVSALRGGRRPAWRPHRDGWARRSLEASASLRLYAASSKRPPGGCVAPGNWSGGPISAEQARSARPSPGLSVGRRGAADDSVGSEFAPARARENFATHRDMYDPDRGINVVKYPDRRRKRLLAYVEQVFAGETQLDVARLNARASGDRGAR